MAQLVVVGRPRWSWAKESLDTGSWALTLIVAPQPSSFYAALSQSNLGVRFVRLCTHRFRTQPTQPHVARVSLVVAQFPVSLSRTTLSGNLRCVSKRLAIVPVFSVASVFPSGIKKAGVLSESGFRANAQIKRPQFWELKNKKPARGGL
jgi:hypothetical protein